MDLYCPVCGEPWDMDELHSVYGMSHKTAVEEFAVKGCELFGSRHKSNRDLETAAISKVAFQLLGDDTDAIAAMMEDYF